MIHVTRHACQRYVERVQPGLSEEAASAAIRAHEAAIAKAAAFGCPTVILPGKVRLVLEGRSVVTVLGRGQICRSLPLAQREARG